MRGLGIVYQNSTQGQGAIAVMQPAAQPFWNQLLTQDKMMLIRFAAMTPEYINAVLNSRLTARDKFFLIFGYKPKGLSGLGNIFEDIGGWFSNTFSQQNISQWENWIRQGSVTAQNIANALNYYSNAPTSQQIANQQQQLQNLQSSVIGTGQGIWETYGTIITAAAVGVAAVLILKK